MYIKHTHTQTHTHKHTHTLSLYLFHTERERDRERERERKRARERERVENSNKSGEQQQDDTYPSDTKAHVATSKHELGFSYKPSKLFETDIFEVLYGPVLKYLETIWNF